MSDPTTEAGRALLDSTYQAGYAPTAIESAVQAIVTPQSILAIEQEAAEAERARIRAAVETFRYSRPLGGGLPFDMWYRNEETLDALLAILDPRSDKEPT